MLEFVGPLTASYAQFSFTVFSVLRRHKFIKSNKDISLRFLFKMCVYVYLEELVEELEAITVLDWTWNAIIENWPQKCLQLLNLGSFLLSRPLLTAPRQANIRELLQTHLLNTYISVNKITCLDPLGCVF